MRYKLKLQFKAYDTRQETTSASVLIDSVAVVPRADGIPFLPPGDLRRQEFDHYRSVSLNQFIYKKKIATSLDILNTGSLKLTRFSLLDVGWPHLFRPTT